MNPKKYLPTNEAFNLVRSAESVPISKALLDAVEIKRDELRNENEENPRKSSQDLTEDYIYIAGMIAMSNWILRLPQRSREFIKKL